MARDPLILKASTAAKLGSIIAHTEEATSIQGHPFDRMTVEALLRSEDVQEWLAAMRELQLLPVSR